MSGLFATIAAAVVLPTNALAGLALESGRLPPPIAPPRVASAYVAYLKIKHHHVHILVRGRRLHIRRLIVKLQVGESRDPFTFINHHTYYRWIPLNRYVTVARLWVPTRAVVRVIVPQPPLLPRAGVILGSLVGTTP